MPVPQQAVFRHGLYFALLALHLLALSAAFQWLVFVTKLLLMPALLWLYVLHSVSPAGGLRTRFILALVFSWIGDCALMMDQKPIFFLVGLSFFLMAHLTYIYTFFHFQKQSLLQLLRKNKIYTAIVAIYAAAVYIFLPPLGELAIPVAVYSVVIGVMLLSAILLRHCFRFQVWVYVGLGALLFVLSDTILAIRRFLVPFPWSSLLVMATYGLAQWLLVQFAVRVSFITANGIKSTGAYEAAENR